MAWLYSASPHVIFLPCLVPISYPHPYTSEVKCLGEKMRIQRSYLQPSSTQTKPKTNVEQPNQVKTDRATPRNKYKPTTTQEATRIKRDLQLGFTSQEGGVTLAFGAPKKKKSLSAEPQNKSCCLRKNESKCFLETLR